MKISYGITVHNEAEELQKLLDILQKNIDEEDEIVVCVDGDDEKVEAVLGEFLSEHKAIVYKRKLEKDFAAHKNSVIEKSGGDYIFHIDADEYPNEILIQQLKEILTINDVDLIWIPRVNTIDGMTQEDIQRWGWRVTEKGWVNYPDYQARVFRNDKSIRWTRPLHEYITGCKTYSHLPPHEELSLYHPKTIEKQTQQNLFYNKNFSRELNVRTGVKKNFEPISLDYFLNMELAEGGGGKEVVKNNGSLKTVRDVVEFYSSNKNIDLAKNTLNPNNWQYFNCMLAEFRKDVADHHELGWDKMTEDYYNSLELMSDKELKVFLKQNPVEFDNGFIKHSYHRACAMIGRLLKGKPYIPFYMEKEKIYNIPWKNDNKIRTPNPLYNIKSLSQLDGFDRSQYCLTQSSILALMGIRSNDDVDIIMNSNFRQNIGIGSQHFKSGNVEIFSPNYDKFMINGAKNDDDLIENFTFEFEGYRFLEPRFYFSRKNKSTDKDKSDWEGIIKFFEMGSHKGYPFNQLSEEQWGVQYI